MRSEFPHTAHFVAGTQVREFFMGFVGKKTIESINFVYMEDFPVKILCFLITSSLLKS